jgi:hypothetical protein
MWLLELGKNVGLLVRHLNPGLLLLMLSINQSLVIEHCYTVLQIGLDYRDTCTKRSESAEDNMQDWHKRSRVLITVKHGHLSSWHECSMQLHALCRSARKLYFHKSIKDGPAKSTPHRAKYLICMNTEINTYNVRQAAGYNFVEHRL